MKATRRPRLFSPLRGAVLLGAVAIGGTFLLSPSGAPGQSIAGQKEAIRGLEVEIAAYDARYAQASQAHDVARTKLAEARERIAKNTKAIKVSQKKYARSQAVLAQRLSKIYRQPQPSQVEVLLRSDSFSDFVSGADMMQRVRRQDSDVVETTRAHRDQLKKQRVQLIADNDEAKKQSAEARQHVNEINAVRNQRRAALGAARTQLQAMIVAEQRRQANAARLAALRQAQQRIAARERQDATPVRSSAPSSSSPSPAQAAPVSAPAPAPETPAPSAPSAPSEALTAIAQCESGGDPTAVSPSGLYRGKYQFDPNTWSSLGGQGSDPAAASEAEQDRVAGLLYSQQGASPWPVCGR